ncbi:tetratricopeptide repeat protein [Streptomyces sp. AS02]|uniref:tetratricopeptide repeat protein n=1 Tax=Streptomyces sp. AS02 TaxID=2938946 RepID=UPI0020206E4C|nr:tetratricopeptide repeat protein [Streptomyces sp. AS02]MCL8009987.1 tetratricopeptide repeat protein [Streptomyces sp. AS02]
MGPGSLGDLKDLLYRLYLSAGTPTLDEIAEDIAADDSLAGAPGRDTIRRCISSPDAPPNQADVIAVAVVLGRRAHWDRDELAARVGGLWVGAHLDERPGKPVCAVTDPFSLEVHRAIDVAPPPTGTALPELPVYVERAHDAVLRAVVTEAGAGTSRLVTLVGESSTGKTRACWEALRTLPAGWRLWHPIDPTRPEAALAELARLAPRTVVWLNDAQHYLLTPGTDLGERVAAGLRTLLGDARREPVLVLGTMWPEYWMRLTTQPTARTGADPHAQARELLTGHELRVPTAFSGPDLRAAVRGAEHDPRLKYAVEHAEQGQITQYLAGAPALLERYRTAPAAARALIVAAMDARRLGHGPALPLTLLAAGAEGYLTDAQWDLLGDDWLDTALADVSSPLRGTRGPLSRIRPREGRTLPAEPCLRLADYLDQHGRRNRRTAPVPETLWNALAAHSAAADRLKLAREARDRGLLRIAARLYDSAAVAGETGALLALADLLDDAGRPDEALDCYRRAAESDGVPAIWAAAEMLHDNGRADEALFWYRQAAEAGDERAVRVVAELLEEAGNTEEAIPWYQRAARSGDRDAVRAAAYLLHGSGQVDEAIDWLRPWAVDGDGHAWRVTARFLARAGRMTEAADAYGRAAALGEPHAVRDMALLPTRPGPVDENLAGAARDDEPGRPAAPRAEIMPGAGAGTEETLARLRERADKGDARAMRAMGETLWAADRIDEALVWLRRAVDTGGADALGPLAELLAEAGRADEALACYQRAADGGDVGAMWAAARMLNAAGRVDEALDWYRRAAEADGDDGTSTTAAAPGSGERPDEAVALVAEAGRYHSVEAAAEALAELGDVDEALALLQEHADAGHVNALWAQAGMLREAGRTDAAVDAYRRAAAAGSEDALWSLAVLLCEEGRAADARDVLRFAPRRFEPMSDAEIVDTVAGMLEMADRTDEALSWYWQAADAGSRSALERAVELSGETGREEETLGRLRRRAEAGDAWTARSVAEVLAKRGHVDEAFDWYRRAAEQGDPYAAREAADMFARADRREDGLLWLRDHAQRTGDIHCLWKGAGMLLDWGRVDEAVSWFQQAADCGYPLALPRAVQLLHTAGRGQESTRLRKFGWEPDGSTAGPW